MENKEFVILLEAYSDETDIEALREFLSNRLEKYGFKIRAFGTEEIMRNMLIDRANFIQEVTKDL